MPNKFKITVIFNLLIPLYFLGIQNVYAFTTAHTYDSLNRLIKTEYSNGTTVTYSYDPMGNRLRKTVTRQFQPLEVGESDADYTSIQAAIDEAYDGDTILVNDGIYPGTIDFMGKSITVKSKNGYKHTILDGDGYGPVVSITAKTFGNSPISNPTLEGFTIKNGAGDYGGGIYCDTNTSPLITNNKIVDNSADFGGGIYCESKSSPTITQNIIAHNTALYHGAGIYAEASGLILQNNTIFKNSAGENGGGIAAYINSSMLLVNNTFTQNTAVDYGAGIYSDEASNTSIINTILWNDGVELAGVDPNIISSSNIKNEAFAGSNGNISLDPLFINPNQENFHLMMDSPCRDAGNPAAQYNDRDGTPNDMGADGGPYGALDTLIPYLGDIQATPPSGAPPLDVSFAADTSDEWGIANYGWDFDDADGIQTDSNQRAPVHTFNETGGYLVTVKVTDHNGFSNTATVMITVSDPGALSPTVSATALPQYGHAPLLVDFSVTAQDQDDGYITNYQWDYDGNGAFDWESESTGDTTYTFIAPGGYQAKICVVDDVGLKDMQLIPITVIPESCVVEKMKSVDKGMASEIEVTEPDSALKGVKITIPQHALPEDTIITISEIQECPALPPDIAGLGLPIDFGPDGIQFSGPVMISIPYSQDQLVAQGISNPDELKLYYYDATTSCWANVPIKQVDRDNQLIIAEIGHFSIFQLGYITEGAATPENSEQGNESTSGGDQSGGGSCFINMINPLLLK